MSSNCNCSKWMNEEKVLEWLGVSRSFMNKYAKEKKLNISYLNGKRGKMYDRKQIEAILDNNCI